MASVREQVAAAIAGHDALARTAHTPLAMLPVLSVGGLSHHPDGSTTGADAGAPARVLPDLVRLGSRGSSA